jgi:integrase
LLNKLTTLAVRSIHQPGWYGDGGGLWLRADAEGGKKWVFIFQWRGRRAEMGLGPIRDVDLKEARALREDARRLVRAGQNPIGVRKQDRAKAAEPNATFGEWAEEIAPAIGPSAEKARKAWVSMMQEKVGALAQMSPAAITTEDVLTALKPYWVSRPESGQRMRQRIERVLDAAKSKGLISDPWQNPARLKGHLENLLERRAKPVAHRLALPFAEGPAFMKALRALDRPAAAALQFTILTAVRGLEARGARWSEIDFKEKVWTIPAGRMKGEQEKRREHRVPLSRAVIAVLKAARADRDPKRTDLVFPCPAADSGMFSENALQDVVNDMGFKGRATVHGFRSTFRDWAGETTDFQRETIEAALAHLVGDQTERAYRRGDALEKRRGLMTAWGEFLVR